VTRRGPRVAGYRCRVPPPGPTPPEVPDNPLGFEGLAAAPVTAEALAAFHAAGTRADPLAVLTLHMLARRRQARLRIDPRS
jgi:hypothetical protein